MIFHSQQKLYCEIHISVYHRRTKAKNNEAFQGTVSKDSIMIYGAKVSSKSGLFASKTKSKSQETL